jgi:BirA family biotin operon repressor/biotin-[acetyl-CoA-carboxylase] ligase
MFFHFILGQVLRWVNSISKTRVFKIRPSIRPRFVTHEMRSRQIKIRHQRESELLRLCVSLETIPPFQAFHYADRRSEGCLPAAKAFARVPIKNKSVILSTAAPQSARARDAALFALLFQRPGAQVTRRELARAAKISPDELEPALAPYLQAGYPIAFHPQGGVALQDPPDIWCAEEIIGRCPPKKNLPAWDPLLLSKTTSTNSVAREQARKGAKSGFLVAASQQSRGRGRLGRAWESSPGLGLYISILVRPEMPLAETGRLTILSSVAAADAVEAVSGLRPKIKWPNDLILKGRKLAGLLIETEPRGRDVAFAVVGIGINVRHQAGDFSDEVRPLATSLFLATKRLHRRADLLVALLHAFERRLLQPHEEVQAAWAASSLTLGQQVTLVTTRGRKQGQALGLDPSGALLLRNAFGEVEVITAGDMQGA